MKLKETIMIAIAALAFMLITGIAKADDKTISVPYNKGPYMIVDAKDFKTMGKKV